MLVARTTAPKRIEFQQRPVPSVGADEALIRVEHVTLCGTDLHIWEGEYVNPFPLVQGHEFVGRVVKTGEEFAGARVGDRVVPSPMRFCRRCSACRAGRHNVCEHISVLGCYEDGALADYVVVPSGSVWRVPDGLPADLAPLSEPVSIAMQAVRRGRPEAGELALVLGCGPIGLIATRHLSDLGVDVVAADTVTKRAETAGRFGAVGALVIDPAGAFPSRESVTAAGQCTPDRPVTLVIEATGSPDALAGALEIAAHASRVVLVGISDRTAQIPMRTIPLKELDVLGSRNSRDLIGEGLGFVNRHRALLRSLITHRFAVTDLEVALRTMRDDAANVGKILIDLPAVNE
ncbi:alcohol dehydrogenase catalytic domain-containing protein [Acrocarpospora catenulata]|uniref:alcohol dehydrogenase catalytic domain-containing protein n=1 Tax=Acrocarpospora catenulata TaxID=2836182 RepID=UPI001BD9D546|nr:alcohol dehydrogenase catalytic domain-containing protein [Acrocarpospora catenulata]